MIKGILLINGLLQHIVSIIISGQCSCYDYSTTMCQNYNQCQIHYNMCGELNCEKISKEEVFKNTNYKCQWDNIKGTCESHKKNDCSDVNKNDCANYITKDLSCDLRDGNCYSYECDKASFNACRHDICCIDNDKCQIALKNFSCNNLELTKCKFYYPGNGKVCNLNDMDKCQTYNYYYNKDLYFDFRCSEWSDSKAGCIDIYCIYDDIQKLCRHRKCVEIDEQSKCKSNRINDNDNQIQLCQWKDNFCQDVREKDILQFSKIDCEAKTANSYFWSDNNKCEKCKQTQLVATQDPCYGCCSPNFSIANCSELQNYYPKLTHCFQCSLTSNCTQVKSEYHNLKSCFDFPACTDCSAQNECPQCPQCPKCPDCPDCFDKFSEYVQCQNIQTFELSELIQIYNEICNQTIPNEDGQINPNYKEYQPVAITFICVAGIEFFIIVFLCFKHYGSNMNNFQAIIN